MIRWEEKAKEKRTSMPKRATTIVLSEKEQEGLLQITKRQRSEQQVVLRARIVLAAAQGHTNVQIANELGINVDTVRLWRDRWAGLQGIDWETLSLTETEIEYKTGPLDTGLEQALHLLYETFEHTRESFFLLYSFLHLVKLYEGRSLPVVLPASSVHSCIGGCLWRSGHNLHQFDRIAVRIVHPVLQIMIQTLLRGSGDLKAPCCKLTQGS